MKKFIILTLIATVLFSLFAFSSHAEAKTEEFVTENTTQGETNAKVEDEENTPDASSENIFEVAYNELLKHSDKLFSALAFVGSIILAFAYNKGLMPLLKAALEKLGATVSNLKEAAEKTAVSSSGAIEELSTGFCKIDELIRTLSERICELEKKLDAEQNATKSEQLRTIMSTQVDLLYDVFISSSLPHYQKEAVGAKIQEMRKTLGVEDEK